MTATSETVLRVHLLGDGAREFLRRSPTRLLIGGQWVESLSGATFDVIDPTSEDVLASCAAASAADVDRAVKAAREAFDFGSWPRMSPSARGKVLNKFADLMDKHHYELCQLEALNNGMAMSTAGPSTTAAADTVRWFAGSAEQIHGHTPQSDGDSFNYTLRDPVGVCAAVIPWNSPITNWVWKVSPALAAGNVLILKPAELTPLTAVRLGELMVEAGLPEGVLNIVTGFGDPAGSALAAHLDVDKIAFTGSTATGRKVLAAATGNLKHVTLELGGKSPNIVFDDADVEAAVNASLIGFTAITGQVCLAGTRLFAQQGIHDEFVELLAEKVRALTSAMGDPLLAETAMGPLASKEQFDKVSAFLQLGKDQGATAVVGGGLPERPGYFVEPTVFTGVTNDMRIAREEIFGPVLSVIPFADEDEAVALANDTEYGLASAVWTKDLKRAHTVARRIKAGTVWVNNYFVLDPRMPFGGYKQSGIGRDFGLDWYLAYTEPKSVFVSL